MNWHSKKSKKYPKDYRIDCQYETLSKPTNVQHFNYQLTHTTLKKRRVTKISKTAATCFGLQGNHHQGYNQYLAKNYTLG